MGLADGRCCSPASNCGGHRDACSGGSRDRALPLQGEAGLVAGALMLAAIFAARQYANNALDIAAFKRRARCLRKRRSAAALGRADPGWLPGSPRPGERAPGQRRPRRQRPDRRLPDRDQEQRFPDARSRTHEARREAHRMRARSALGVTPVICLHRRPERHWTQENVAIVGIDRLGEFTRAQRGRGADIDRLTSLAARG